MTSPSTSTRTRLAVSRICWVRSSDSRCIISGGTDLDLSARQPNGAAKLTVRGAACKARQPARSEGMADFATAVEARLRTVTTGVFDYFLLGGRALRFIFSRPFYWRDTLTQMDRIGVGSIPIVLLTGLFTGMVLALQSSVELSKFGADVYVGNLVGASMIRELGPVLASLMVAGRTASGITAEIGSMRVTEQIDALQSFGTDPIKKLVTPRLLAALIMLPVLTMMADVVGIIGGLIVAGFLVWFSCCGF